MNIRDIRFTLLGSDCGPVSEEVKQQEEELRLHHVQRGVRAKGTFGDARQRGPQQREAVHLHHLQLHLRQQGMKFCILV